MKNKRHTHTQPQIHKKLTYFHSPPTDISIRHNIMLWRIGHQWNTFWQLWLELLNSVCYDAHYSDVIMGAMESQITSLTIVYSTVYSGTDKRKHRSSASLAFERRSHRWPVNSPHKGPVMRKTFPFDDVITLTVVVRTSKPILLRCNFSVLALLRRVNGRWYRNVRKLSLISEDDKYYAMRNGMGSCFR